MGQYYLVVNLDKGEYLDPHRFGDGLKLLEFGPSGKGVMAGLAILLADGNNRGGGDLRSESEIIGSWKGHRIVVAGDYADPGNFMPGPLKDLLLDRMLERQLKREDIDEDESTLIRFARENTNLYHLAREFYQDVSKEVIKAMCDDPYLKKGLENRKTVSYKRDAKYHLKRLQTYLVGLKRKGNDESKIDELWNRIEKTGKEIEELEDYKVEFEQIPLPETKAG